MKITVGYEHAGLVEQAQALAHALNIPLDNTHSIKLMVMDERLVLSCPPFSPLYADFNIQTWQKRRNAGKQQGLVKACKPSHGITILDATAGWGRDAAILSSFGARVLMLERHPIMAVLLQNALEKRDERSKAILNLQLLNIEAIDYLETLELAHYPDVIYLDPMHPERTSSALVKKDMQILQQLMGADQQVEVLLKIALRRAKQRVVVKWPQALAPIIEPSYTVPGKTVRFDIYTISR